MVSKAAVTVAQWTAWIDTKAATVASALGAKVNVAQVEDAGRAAVERTQAEEKAKFGALAEIQQEQIKTIRQADAARLAAAKQLEQKIADAGKQAGDYVVNAVDSAKPVVQEMGREASMLAVKGLVDGLLVAAKVAGGASQSQPFHLHWRRKHSSGYSQVPQLPAPCLVPKQ